MIGTYAVQGLMSFLPTFLVEFRGYSAASAGAVFSAFFLIRTGGQIAVGRLSDRFGRDIAIGAAMLAGAVGMGALVAPVHGSRLLVAVAVLLAGVGASFFSAIDPRFMDALGDAERGAGFGLVRTAYTVVGAAGSVGVGLAADLFGWGVSFASLAALFAGAFALLSANELLGTGY